MISKFRELHRAHSPHICRQVLLCYLQALAIGLMDLFTGSIVTFAMRRQGVRVVELDLAVRALNYASGIKDACDVVSMSRSRPGSVESNCTDGGDEAGSELVISAASTVCR